MRRILIVEDDRDLSDITARHLQSAGYETDRAYSVEDGFSCLDEQTYDLVLLDVLLPGGDGFSLCRAIRQKCHCPVIFISCLDDSSSVLTAFGAGADDYVTKPVRYEELLARVDANIRRALVYNDNSTPAFNENLIRLKNMIIDKQHRRVRMGEREVDLSSIEFALLLFFVSHRGALLLYEELYRHVWGADCIGDVRTVLVHVSNLRKKIDPEHTGMIETVRGAGYIFSED